MAGHDVQERKRRYRARAAARPATTRRAADGAALAAAAPVLLRGSTGPVTGFWPRPDEPDVVPLLTALSAAGRAVLLPVLREDDDLGWAPWRPEEELVTGRRGTRRPAGPLRADGLAGVGLLLVPAVAVDTSGTRLGRGGGSYDRALARRERASLVVAVVHDDAVADGLPAQEHDVPVDAVLTPRGGLRSTGRAGAAAVAHSSVAPSGPERAADGDTPR